MRIIRTISLTVLCLMLLTPGLCADDDGEVVSLRVNNLTPFPLLRLHCTSYDSGDEFPAGEDGIEPWTYVSLPLPAGAWELTAYFTVDGREIGITKEFDLNAPFTWTIREDDPGFSADLPDDEYPDEDYDAEEDGYDETGGGDDEYF